MYKVTICNFLAATNASQEYCLSTIKSECMQADCMALYLALYAGFHSGSTSLLDEAVRAIAISLDFVEISNQMFLHVEPYYEFTTYGVLLPQNFRIIPYFPNFNEGKDFDGDVNVVFGFITIFMIFVVAYNIFASSRGGVNYKYLMTFTGLFNFLSLVLMLIHIKEINSLNSREIKGETLLTERTLENDIRAYNIALSYERIILIKGLLGGILICRLGLFFRLNSRVEVIIKALERGLPSFIMLAGFIIPYIVILAYAGNVILGISILPYKSFSFSLASVFSLVLGFQNGEFGLDLNWASFFYLMFSVFTLYLLVPGIAYAIFVEAFRFTVMSFGHEFHGEDSKWTWRQYFQWIFSWVPSRVQSRLEKLKKYFSRRGLAEACRKFKMKIEELKNKRKKGQLAMMNTSMSKKEILEQSANDSTIHQPKYGKVRYLKK